MPNFFTQCWSKISFPTTFSSTTGQRNTQRAMAAAEITGTTLATFTPVAVIPTKVAQTCLSIYSLFRTDLKADEKAVQVLQGSIAAAQLGLAITMLFTAQACATDTTGLCEGVLLTQLLYNGVMLTGWIPSEFSKEPYTAPEAQAARVEV